MYHEVHDKNSFQSKYQLRIPSYIVEPLVSNHQSIPEVSTLILSICAAFVTSGGGGGGEVNTAGIDRRI